LIVLHAETVEDLTKESPEGEIAQSYNYLLGTVQIGRLPASKKV
jgi:hypothetical protein